jgi:hypothetical protein
LIAWKSTGSALERKGSATGPAISNASLAAVALTPHLVVTAVPTAGGGGELVSWSIGASGAVALGNTVPLPGQWLSAAKLDSRNVAIGFQDPEGTVGTLLYTVTATAIGYEAEIFNTQGSITSVAAINSGEFVTAISTNLGTLQLDSWSVSQLGAVAHQATASAGAISRVAITADGTGGVATAVRNSAGDLGGHRLGRGCQLRRDHADVFRHRGRRQPGRGHHDRGPDLHRVCKLHWKSRCGCVGI